MAERTSSQARIERAPPAAPLAATQAPGGGQLLLRRLTRKPLVRWSLIVLALLYASAIYAPLVANDRPYWIVSIDRREYSDAQRSLEPIALELVRLLDETPEQYQARRTAGSTHTHARALTDELDAARMRLRTLLDYIAPGDAAVLEECGAQLERCHAALRAARMDAARVHAARVRELARVIGGDEFVALDPAQPRATGKQLVPAASFPLFAALTAGDVFFMLSWAAGIGALAGNRLFNRSCLKDDAQRIRRWLAFKVLAVVTIALAGVLLQRAFAGEGAASDPSRYKTRLSAGTMVAQRVVFAPIALGFAETKLDEAYRPPTWTRSSVISADGRYARDEAQEQAESAGAFRPPPTPVAVLAGEAQRNAPLRHPFGTDGSGRDLLARILWGGRVSLAVGLLAALLLVAIGTIAGAIAGYCGGTSDLLISRLIEIVLCFPALFLILTVLAVTDPAVLPPVLAIVLVIGIVAWTGVARLVRAEFLRLRELEFVLAARALGCSPARTVVRHMLPNALGPVLVALTFAIASATLTESALSFLGLGVSEPVPSWGSLINESHSAEHWWIQLFPGLFILVTVVCYNFIGEGLRDALDPRARV